DNLEAEPLLQETLKLWEKVDEAMSGYDPRSALEAIWAVITMANQFVEEKKPWVLAKDAARQKELALTLAVLGECMAHLAAVLLPFLPETARKILSRMKLPTQTVLASREDYVRRMAVPGTDIER